MRQCHLGRFACLTLAVAMAWLVLGTEEAAAQRGGTGGTTGGQTSGGQTSGGQTTGGGFNTGGTGSLGSGGFGTGSLGTGSLGTGSTGTGSTNSGSGTGGGSGPGATGDFQLQSDTGLSQLQQNAAANQAQAGFVGGPNADAQNATFSIANPNATGGNNAISMIDGFFRQLNALNSNAGNVRTSRRVIRAPLRVGFAVSRPSNAVVASRFMERFGKNPILREVGEVEATLEDETMTLTGYVRSDEERVMVEQQALLEPGVARVNNQLTVNAVDR